MGNVQPAKKKAAYQFIVLMGLVSLFGDITYESARSVIGPFMLTLGAGAATVGFVTGFGELLGYALRLVSGYVADRTRSYWTLTAAGYGLLISIPLLAFASLWQMAAVFIVLERVGKAIRSPARDTILSHATAQVGRGWGFGIHEAMDQFGAMTGPLIFSAVFLLNGSYRTGFSLLWIPAFLSVLFVFIAKNHTSYTEHFEEECTAEDTTPKRKLSARFWLYTVFIFFSVFGFVSFQLISYHMKAQSVISDAYIPLLYALAMGIDAVVALIIGKTYDKIGLNALLVIPFLTFSIPIFGFSSVPAFLVVSVILWGMVMGIHETIMRAALADLTSTNQRGTAYGIFNAVYGFSFFAGSSLTGILYSVSFRAIAAFVVVSQLLSLVVFYFLKTRKY